MEYMKVTIKIAGNKETCDIIRHVGAIMVTGQSTNDNFRSTKHLWKGIMTSKIMITPHAVRANEPSWVQADTGLSNAKTCQLGTSAKGTL